MFSLQMTARKLRHCHLVSVTHSQWNGQGKGD